MRNNIQIIALDLDGTLLNCKKRVSKRNAKALATAAENGVFIVPTTGRLAAGLPDDVKAMPFIRYVIGANGARITDTWEHKDLMNEAIPNSRVLEILDLAKKYDALYDCYIDESGYISADMLDRAADYTIDEHHLELMHNTRKPVDNLDAYVRDNNLDALKVQFLFRSTEDRDAAIKEIQEALPDCLVTSSYPNNLEINSVNANKGAALKYLSDYLNIPIKHTMSFGDGTNDISMLEIAGIGVAMENAAPEVFPHGALIAPDCNNDGVGRIIEQYCGSQRRLNKRYA